MGFLALDQSKASTGWAVWQHGWEKPRYGHIVLGTEHTGDGQTFTKLRTVIIDLFGAMIPFEFLFYESPIAQKKHVIVTEKNALMLIGLRAVIEGVGYELRCRSVDMISADDWRPDFLSRDENRMIKRAARQAQKSATDPLKAACMERCRQLGFSPKKTDEADAIGILTYGILSKGFTPPWLANEVLRAPLVISA